jgi:hypothetical protein
MIPFFRHLIYLFQILVAIEELATGGQFRANHCQLYAAILTTLKLAVDKLFLFRGEGDVHGDKSLYFSKLVIPV